MTAFQKRFYGETDPREMPMYEIAEAAKYLRLPYYTLYSWLQPVKVTKKDGYANKPLIKRPDQGVGLSFMNLIEGHVLKALVRDHRMPLSEVRQAIDYAESEYGLPRLLTREFEVGLRQIFIKRMGNLLSIGRGGQFAMEKVLENHLARITYKDSQPVNFNPFVLDGKSRYINISPDFAFGKPIVSSAKITTYIIAERFDLGDEKEEIAKDYKITEAEVEAAILYEKAAA